MPEIRIISLKGRVNKLTVEQGVNLRKALLDKGLSPYTNLTHRLNCGGNGICATCGVWIEKGVSDPKHWHDRAARRFGYPRLSCQINVEEDMTIRQVDKWIWGGRRRED